MNFICFFKLCQLIVRLHKFVSIFSIWLPRIIETTCNNDNYEESKTRILIWTASYECTMDMTTKSLRIPDSSSKTF